jgi:hypothetical protein
MYWPLSLLLIFFHSTSQYLNPDQGLDEVLNLIFYLVTSMLPYEGYIYNPRICISKETYSLAHFCYFSFTHG